MHCIVKTSYNKEKEPNEAVYELSIFGIILILANIRLLDRESLKHRLFLKHSYPVYVEKIAKNYDDKFPLIFGKWSILKDVLNLYSAYNFDIIVDKDIRTGEPSTISLIRGGQ